MNLLIESQSLSASVSGKAAEDPRTVLTLFLAIALAAPTGAPADTAAFTAQDARLAAMIRGDASFLESALDESLTYQHSTGTSQSKTEFIEAIRAGTLKYRLLDIVERKARHFGPVTIITGILRLQAANDAGVIDIKARFTDVYERRDGRLVQVAWQNTRIP